MNYKFQTVIGNMKDECGRFSAAIKRISLTWDDKVYESIHEKSILPMMKKGKSIESTTEIHSKTIEQLLDEMEMYARR